MKMLSYIIGITLLFTVLAAAQRPVFDTIPAWSSAFVSYTMSVAWGDVDGDGDLDLACGNAQFPSRLYLNNSGRLDALDSWRTNSIDPVFALAWGDVDGDGDLDLASASGALYLNHYGVLDTSSAWTPEEDIIYIYSLAWADFDNDGDLDLACGMTERYPFRIAGIYLNDGGSLQDTMAWGHGLPPDGSGVTREIIVADLDNNGFVDLIQGLYVYYNSNGILDTVPNIISPDSMGVYSVAAGDIDGNGYTDLVVGMIDQRPWPYLKGVATFYNSATGFDSVAVLSTGYRQYEFLQLGDLNGNGLLDLVAGSEYGSISIHLNIDGRLDSIPSDSIPANVLPYEHDRFALADMDADGDLDLAVSGHGNSVRYGEINMVFLNNSTGLFDDTAGWWSDPSQVPRPRSIAVTDIDTDRYPEILFVGSTGWPTISLFDNNGGVLSNPRGVTLDADTAFAVAPADINNSGDPSLAVWVKSGDSSEIRLYYNYGGGISLVPGFVTADNPIPWSLEWADMNGDGFLDLIAGSDTGMHSRVYYNHGGSLDTIAGLYIPGKYSTFITSGDIDGDADYDLVTGAPAWYSFYWEIDTLLRLYLNNNGILDTISSSSWHPENPRSESEIVLADFSGNGLPDLLVVGRGDTVDARIYYNTDGQLDTEPGWQVVDSQFNRYKFSAVGDIDADGDLDVAFSASWDAVRVYLNTDGRLGTDIAWSTPRGLGATRTIALEDMDNDGDLDLILLNAWRNRIEIFYNSRLHRPPQGVLPNDPVWLSDLTVRGDSVGSDAVSIEFALQDDESDPADVKVSFSMNGGGQWHEASILESTNGLATDASGQSHTLTWDILTDEVDGHDVWLMISVSSIPHRAGQIRWPTKVFQYKIGRLPGRPLVDLMYPKNQSIVVDSFPLLGRIWDRTDFSTYRVEIAALPDTAAWSEVANSSISHIKPGHINSIEATDLASGQYVLRVIASDARGSQRVIDRHIVVSRKEPGAPNVWQYFPESSEVHVPGNAPVVVQFDRDINQPSLDNKSLVLYSELYESYSNSLYDYKTRTLTIVPDKPYTDSKFHYFVVNGSLPSLGGVRLGGEFVSSFNTSAALPTEDIDSLSPFRGQVLTPVSQESLSIYYNRPSTHRFVTVFSLAGDTIMNDTISDGWYPGTVPISGLLPKTYYLVRISDDLLFDGASDYMSYFITEDTEMPVVLDHSPEDSAWLVGLTEEVSVTFNKSLNTHTVDSTSFYVMGPTGKVLGFISFGVEGDSVLSFAPAASYLPGTEYTVVLTSHIQDNIGNRIDSMSWSFTTGVFDTISYDGGTISSGNIELRFPMGTVGSEVEIGMGVIPPGQVAVDPVQVFAGLAIDIEPDVQLARGAVVTFDVPDSLIAEYGPMNALKLYYYDSSSGAWEYVGGTVSGDRVSASVDRLGRYGLFQSDVSKVSTDFASSLTLNPRVIGPRTGGANAELTISFETSEASEVTAKIYNTSGRLVKTLWSGHTSSVGANLIRWSGRESNGSFADDGLYIVVVETADKKAQKTFVIVNR